MNRAPERKIRVVESDTNHTVARLPLVYQEFAPFGIIIREVLTSRPYQTDSEGYAQVPDKVSMMPAPGTGYHVDRRSRADWSLEEIQSADILRVRKVGKPMRTAAVPDDRKPAHEHP